MRYPKIAASFALPAMLMATDKPPAPPIQPSDDWALNRTPGMCFLTRPYGNGQITFDAMPGQSMMGITVIWPRNASISGERMSVKLLPTGAEIADGGSVVVLPGEKMGLHTAFHWSRRAELDHAGMLSFETTSKRVAFALKPPADIAAAFEGCFAELYKKWGVDPARLKWAGEPGDANAMGNIGRFFDKGDYPASALRKGQGGTTSALAEIDDRGNAKSCRVLDRSGVDALDTATCKAAMRIRNVPKPGWMTFRVRWTITSG